MQDRVFKNISLFLQDKQTLSGIYDPLSGIHNSIKLLHKLRQNATK